LYSAEEGQDDQLEQIQAAHQELGLATYEVDEIPFNIPFRKAIQDCPCHGSRFDIDGNMLNGPATTGLSKLDID